MCCSCALTCCALLHARTPAPPHCTASAQRPNDNCCYTTTPPHRPSVSFCSPRRLRRLPLAQPCRDPTRAPPCAATTLECSLPSATSQRATSEQKGGRYEARSKQLPVARRPPSSVDFPPRTRGAAWGLALGGNSLSAWWLLVLRMRAGFAPGLQPTHACNGTSVSICCILDVLRYVTCDLFRFALFPRRL